MREAAGLARPRGGLRRPWGARGPARPTRPSRSEGPLTALTALLALLVLLVTGCASATSGPRADSENALARQAATPAAMATVLAAPPAVASSPAAGAVPSGIPAEPPGPQVSVVLPTGLVLQGDGRTAPGPYFLGKIDAPIALEEYGDFQ